MRAVRGGPARSRFPTNLRSSCSRSLRDSAPTDSGDSIVRSEAFLAFPPGAGWQEGNWYLYHRLLSPTFGRSREIGHSSRHAQSRQLVIEVRRTGRYLAIFYFHMETSSETISRTASVGPGSPIVSIFAVGAKIRGTASTMGSVRRIIYHRNFIAA